jgi:hypothetical protein
MLEKTKLEEISSELPESERRELLARIKRSLSREAWAEYSPVELKQEERERLVAEEMQNLSFWARLVLWLKGLFSVKTKRDLFVHLKIQQLKRGIRHRSSGLTGFETRDLTSKFARHLFDVYHASFPLRDLFQLFHTDHGFRSRAVLHLFDVKLPEAKRSLEDFLPLEEMEQIYHDSGSEEEVRRQLLRNFNEYVRHIPDRLVRQIEEGLKPLTHLKNLVLFPYAGTFRHFNYQPTPGMLQEKYPLFSNAPVMLMLEQLERLLHALNLAAGLGTEWFCHEELFAFYLEENLEMEEPEGEVVDLDREQELIELTNALVQMVNCANEFLKKVPLLEMLRYFRKDPYYKLVFAAPRFRAKPLFISGLRERLLDELEQRFAEVKKRVIEMKIREIFKSSQLFELFYYVDNPSFDYASLELPYFTYTKSLKVLYNYLSKIYKGAIQETLQIANTYIVSGNRIVQTRLNRYAAGLEELEAKLVLFDRSFAPDEDDGKTLLRLRHRLATDLTQQKLYRGFVLQKDREARTLIDQGLEYLTGIRRVYDDLLTSPMESVKSALKTLHFHKGKNQTLAGILQLVSDRISEFQDLLTQVVALEKGS